MGAPGFAAGVKKARRRLRRALRRAVRRALIAYARGGARPDGADRRVTILLSSAWGMGGTIRASLNLAGYLAQRGWDVEILSAFRRREEPFFGAFPPGVKVTALDDQRPSAARPGVRGRLVAWVRGLPEVLMHRQDRLASAFTLIADLRLVRELRGRTGFLIGTRPGLNFFAAELAPPGCIPIGAEQMHLRHHAKPLKAAMPKLYPRLAAIAVLTEEDLESYRQHLDGRAPKLVRIPNTVRPMEGDIADLTAKTVLAAGRLTPQKGFDLLLRAWAEVAEQRPDWQLRICGRGQQREELAQMIEEFGLNDRVSLEGPSQQLGEDMAKASVFALSSRFEGFPLILLEAMSKGMAVVAFDCPTGPRDVIEDHRNGILVPRQDVDRFAAGLLEMTSDEGLRRRCAAAAIETARRYTMEAIGPQWETLLDELAAARQAERARAA